MSLIQEALRRKEEEEGRGHLPALDLAPPAPSPAVSTPEPRRESSWVVVLRGLCYFVLFAGAGAGLVALYRSAAPSASTASVANLPVAERAPTPAVVLASSAPVPPAIAEPVPELVQVVEPLPAVAPVSTARPTPRPPAEEIVPAGSWPELRVMGVFARPRPEDSSAVINGELEDVGTKIRGVQLVAVKQNGVTLRFRGEEKFVRVGKTTLK